MVAGLREPLLSIDGGTRPEGRDSSLMFMRRAGVAGIRSGLTFVVAVPVFEAAEEGGPDGGSELCNDRGIERSVSFCMLPDIDIDCI